MPQVASLSASAILPVIIYDLFHMINNQIFLFTSICNTTVGTLHLQHTSISFLNDLFWNISKDTFEI